MKTAFVYSDKLAGFDYGAGHPLRPFRLKLTYELINACGLLAPLDPRVFVPGMASREDLLTFHTLEYITILEAVNSGEYVAGSEAFGLGPGDNPIFSGMLDWSRLVAGASLMAADLVDSGEAAAAFNIAGGLHHAHAAEASGFCYVNDCVLAIQLLVKRGRRVAYIDIDAHHGDGVQDAFYDTDRVLTISLHETGQTLFPGTGYERDSGIGAGAGYSVNAPLPPQTDDELFVHAFSNIVPPLIDAFRPDIVVSQLGTDTFRSDPITHLNATTNGFCRMVSMIKSLAPKWVALGGGGYNIANAARAWTLAWAIMNDCDAPVEIPAEFLERHPEAGFPGRKLRDEPYSIEGRRKEEMREEVNLVIDTIRDRVLRTLQQSCRQR